MLGGLIFVPLPLLALSLSQPLGRGCWREAVVRASLLWGAGIAVFTELLSLLQAFSYGPVLAGCLGVNVAVAVFLVRRRAGVNRPVLGSAGVRVMAAALGVLLLLTLVTAVVAPPNTPDVISYHLPRQLFWIQQAGMQHFETADARALMMPPWAEMVQAQAMILSGGDAWANLPQWISYGLGMIVTSLLARELGVGRFGQCLAALFFATLPMAYLEASSAKNDLWVAVWIGVLVWLAMRAGPGDRRRPLQWVELGAALGLALATKTTAWVFAAPVFVLIARPLVRDRRGLLIATAMVLAVVGPHWVRNQLWYGTPLGVHRAEDGGAQGNEDFSWRGVVSIAARNATLHLATPFLAINQGLKAVVLDLHRALGRDAQDPRTTLLAIDYEVRWLPRNEATAGAPVHAVLGAVALLGALGLGGRGRQPLVLAGLVVGGLVLTCVLLKWQPWGARLHLPVFVLLAALSAALAERAGIWLGAVGGVLAVAALLPSLEPDIRPLWSSPSIFAESRWENFFRTHPGDRAGAETALAALAVARVETLAVVVSHGFPYPLLRRYLDAEGGKNRLWMNRPAVSVTAPQGVVVVDRMGYAQPLYLTVGGVAERYRAVGSTDPFRIYLPEARARELERVLPLPHFVGWDRAAGLGRPAAARSVGGELTVRRMTGPVLHLDFRREASPTAVRFVAAYVQAGRCDLELRLDGRRIARVEFEGGAGLQAVEVPLVPQGERGELSLTAVAGDATGMVFSELQIKERAP